MKGEIIPAETRDSIIEDAIGSGMDPRVIASRHNVSMQAVRLILRQAGYRRVWRWEQADA